VRYDRFEDVPVWRSSADAVVRTFSLADDRAFAGRGDLRDQLQRAALSITNNIAEGFERGLTSELITFLYYAKGSAGEARSMLLLCQRLPTFSHLRSEISDLVRQFESISRQLAGWLKSLQASDVEGVKRLNGAVRDQHDLRRRATALEARLRDIVETARRGPPPAGSAPV
jgi:four helix bundle protein